jgi:hypothetical protein
MMSVVVVEDGGVKWEKVGVNTDWFQVGCEVGNGFFASSSPPLLSERQLLFLSPSGPTVVGTKQRVIAEKY